ncbi:hypothetical protein M378DRAFT_168040 [Amanita muscaria Koide BX008]|uniref:Uncharacterized protein n=1 Tax=Amanita muscaria (strain Koide BX008) TaxID=946122 RepID=A0A0C2SCC0_AMAMK|nr:hypothetical protein M378DRAFT_168040 [Amanita muscaria Koide BX008]
MRLSVSRIHRVTSSIPAATDLLFASESATACNPGDTLRVPCNDPSPAFHSLIVPSNSDPEANSLPSGANPNTVPPPWWEAIRRFVGIISAVMISTRH